jgi:carbonic anhydrase/acetyltransferase-like protein (isoleucine patch superfamily)
VIYELDGYRPEIADDTFVAPTAAVVGNVTLGTESSIWFSAVLRADHGDNAISIGYRTNIQDGCVIHVSTHRGTIIGHDVTIGHGALLEGCTVHDGAVVGMNSVILEDAEIGEGSLVAAGTVVPVGFRVPDGVLVAGVPGQIKKRISGQSARWIEHSAAHYVQLARRYRNQGISLNS